MLQSEDGNSIAREIQHFDTPTKRSKGMLIFSEAPTSFAGIFHLPFNGFFPLVHTFGMKFPIDILFCDAKKEVLHIYRRVEANRFVLPIKNFFGGCKFLVELSGCEASQIRIGDRLQW